MSKLVRETMLWFGSDAGAQDVGVFGSLAAANPTYSKIIATIQSLPAWGTGWAAETINTWRPALEDMNAVCYVLSYGVSYLHEMGIPEYDAGTVYYVNSFCSYGTSIYRSLADDNLNNLPTSGTANWTPLTVPTPVANTQVANKKYVDDGVATKSKLTAGTPCVQNPVALTTVTSQAHGMGGYPTFVEGYIECLSGDLGYSVGDRVKFFNASISANSGCSVSWDTTNVIILTTENPPYVFIKNTTIKDTVDVTKWKAVAVPYLLS